MVVQTRASSWWVVAAIAVAGSVVLGISSASAQTTYTWANSNVTNTPTTLDWFTGGPNTQATWTGGTPVSSNLNTIQFFTSTAFTNTVAATQASVLDNGGTAFELGTLTLSGRGSFTGNANFTMNLSGDALNFSAATAAINLDAIAAGRGFAYNVANSIQLGTASSATALAFAGDGTSTFNFNGNITSLQAGASSVSKSGTSTLLLSGINTFNGLTLNGGNLVAGNNSTSSGNDNFGAAGSTISVTGNSTISYNGAAPATTYTFDKAINIASGVTLTFAKNHNNSHTYQGVLSGGNNTTVVVNDAGGIAGRTLEFSNTANTFSGTIDLGTNNNATVSVNSLGDASGAGNIKFGRNANASGAFLFGSGAAAPLVLNNRRIEIIAGASVSGVAAIYNNAAHTLTINSDLLVTGAGGTKTLELRGTNAGNNTFGGVISNGGLTALSLTKADAGTWVLSGDNAYTGTTTVTAGILNTTKAAALPGYDSAAKVVINGGTVGVQVGGSGWTTGQVDTLLTNATKTSGALGIDTTNGNLTQWAAFTTTNLGSALGLNKLGVNTLTLDQSNTFAGALTISQGTVSINTINNASSAGVLGNSANAVVLGSSGNTGTLLYTGATASSNKTFTAATSGTGAMNVQEAATNLTLSGAIGGSGNITKEGAGILTLGAANTYTGATTINGGELRWGVANAIAGGPLNINNSGTVNLQTFSDGVGTITIAKGGNIIGTTGTLSTSLVVSNDGGTISGFSAGAGLRLTGGVTYNSTGPGSTTLQIDRIFIPDQSPTVFNIANGDAAIDFEITGALSGGGNNIGRTIRKTGAGVMQFSGSEANTTSTNQMPLDIWDGTVIFNKSAEVDAIPKSAITIGDGIGAAGSAILQFRTSSNQIATSPITVNSDGLFDLNNLSETTGNTLTLNSTGQVDLNGGTLSVSAVTIAATGAGADTTPIKNTAGTGSLTLTSFVSITPAADYTTTLSLGASGTLTLGGDVAFNAAGTGRAQITGSALSLGAANRIFNIGLGTGADYDLLVGAGISGASRVLTKNGAGRLVLTGSNTYSGGTTVNGGTLQIGDGTTAGAMATTGALSLGNATFGVRGPASGGSSQTVASLATSAATGSIIRLTPGDSGDTTLTITSNTPSTGAGSSVNFDYTDGTTVGGAVGNNYVVWNPTLTGGIIGGAYTVTDSAGTGFATTSSGNVVRLTDPGGAGLPVSAGSSTGSYFVASGYSTDSTTTPGSLVVALSGAVAASNVSVDTTGLASGANLTLGTNLLTLGAGMVFDGPNPYEITGSGAGGLRAATSGGTINLYNANTGTVTISAPIVNNSASRVTVDGPGTTILSGVNTYTGATVVNGGTVRFSGTMAASPITINNGAVAQLGTTTGLTSINTVTFGEGSTGSLQLLGNSVTIGALATNATAIGTPVITNNNGGGPVANATLTINSGGSSTTFGGVIQEGTGGGTLGLVKSGAGELTLSGANTYSGGVVVNGGALILTSASNAITGGFTLNGGALRFNNAATVDNSNIIVNGTAGLYVANNTNQSTNANIMLNAGSDLSLGGNGGSITITSAVTGAGSITASRVGSSNGTSVLSSTANTFKGTVSFTQGAFVSFGVNSFVDSDSLGAGNIRFAEPNSQQIFELRSGAIAPVTLNNRRIEFATAGGKASIFNNSSQVFTINTDVLVTAASGNRTLELGGSGSGYFNGKIENGTLTSVILTKTGAGTWVLGNSANSYTGATAVQAGTLVVNKLANFSASSSIGAASSGAIILGNGNDTGTLLYTGGGDETDRPIQVNSSNNTNTGGAAIVNNGSGTLTFTAATFNPGYTNTNSVTRTLTLGGSNNGIIQGVIQDNSATNKVGVTKTGIGTWTLSGSNAYTGPTSVTNGRLVLDYATQNNNKLSDSAALTLGGSELVLKGGSHVETVLSTTLSAGGSVISRDGGTSVVQLNTITRSAGGTLAFAEASIATTDSTNTNGILGGWATIASDWAINGVNGADSFVTALSAYTGALPTATGASAANYTLTGNQSQAGAVAANTVKITTTGNSETLSLGANNLTITATSATSLGGILYAGGGDGNYTIDSTTGRIRPSSNNQELIFQATSGTLTVNALVADNNASSVVTKSGSGTVVLGAANNFSGAVRVNQGALRLTNATGAGTTAGGITVQNGAALELADGISVGAEALSITGTGASGGGALRNVADNTSSYAGAITIGAGGARINSDSGGALTLTGGVVTAIGSDVTFGGAGDTTVSTTGISGVGHVIKTGAGVLTLATGNGQANTTVTEGQLNINHFAALGTTAGTLTMAAGTLLDNTSGTAVTVSNAKAISFGSSVTFVGSNELDLGAGIVTLSGSNTEFNIAAKTLTLSGDVVGAGYGITKTGAGTLVLDGLTGANSFTGNSFVNAGKLVITAGAVLGGGSSTVVTLGAGGFLEVDSATNLGGVSVAGNTQNLISGTIVEANQDFTINQTLSAVNRQYDGVQTIFSGVTVTTATNYLGSVPATATPGRIVFQDNGRLKATAGFTIDSKQGITLQSGTAVFESDAAAQLLVPASVAGSGGIRKVGAGNLRLTGSNTYSGGTFIEQGIIGISYGESLGDVAGGLTIDGGTIVAAQTVAPAPSVSTVTIDPARVVRIGNGKTSGMHAQNGLTLRYDGVITEVDSVGAAGALQFGFDATREGTVILGGANTYRGDTIISHGTLKLGSGGSFASSPRIIVGDATSNSAVLDITEKTTFTIGAGQTLMGKGTVLSQPGTELIVAGLFSPGNSPELFTYDGGLTTLSGTTLFEIWGTGRGLNPGYDAVNVINSGTLTLGGLLQLDFSQNYASDTPFLLIDATGGSLGGAYSSFAVTGASSDYAGLSFLLQSPGVWETGATANDQKLRLTQTSTTLTLDVIAVAVPEPATIVLVASGAAILGSLLARRRRGS